MQRDDFIRRLELGDGRAIHYVSLEALSAAGLAPSPRLPFSVRVLLESVLRGCDDFAVTQRDVTNLAGWNAAKPAALEIPFKPARVIYPSRCVCCRAGRLHCLQSGSQRPYHSAVTGSAVRLRHERFVLPPGLQHARAAESLCTGCCAGHFRRVGENAAGLGFCEQPDHHRGGGRFRRF